MSSDEVESASQHRKQMVSDFDPGRIKVYFSSGGLIIDECSASVQEKGVRPRRRAFASRGLSARGSSKSWSLRMWRGAGRESRRLNSVLFGAFSAPRAAFCIPASSALPSFEGGSCEPPPQDMQPSNIGQPARSGGWTDPSGAARVGSPPGEPRRGAARPSRVVPVATRSLRRRAVSASIHQVGRAGRTGEVIRGGGAPPSPAGG